MASPPKEKAPTSLPRPTGTSRGEAVEQGRAARTGRMQTPVPSMSPRGLAMNDTCTTGFAQDQGAAGRDLIRRAASPGTPWRVCPPPARRGARRSAEGRPAGAGSAHYRKVAFWHISRHFQRTAGSVKKPCFLDVFGVFGGKRRKCLVAFQDRCNRPLCHPSEVLRKKKMGRNTRHSGTLGDEEKARKRSRRSAGDWSPGGCLRTRANPLFSLFPARTAGQPRITSGSERKIMLTNFHPIHRVFCGVREPNGP